MNRGAMLQETRTHGQPNKICYKCGTCGKEENTVKTQIVWVPSNSLQVQRQCTNDASVLSDLEDGLRRQRQLLFFRVGTVLTSAASGPCMRWLRLYCRFAWKMAEDTATPPTWPFQNKITNESNNHNPCLAEHAPTPRNNWPKPVPIAIWSSM